MIMYDIESLDVESTSVILSLAAVYFDPDEIVSYNELLDRALFVKFDVTEQITKYKRTISQSTAEWWRKQAEIPQVTSLIPSKDDVSAEQGLSLMSNYYKGNGKGIVWARGALDQLATESLYRKIGRDPFCMFNMWRDVRTAVDLLYDTSTGYRNIDGFDPSHSVIKHHPVHDCAYDILMLKS